MALANSIVGAGVGNIIQRASSVWPKGFLIMSWRGSLICGLDHARRSTAFTCPGFGMFKARFRDSRGFIASLCCAYISHNFTVYGKCHDASFVLVLRLEMMRPTQICRPTSALRRSRGKLPTLLSHAPSTVQLLPHYHCDAAYPAQAATGNPRPSTHRLPPNDP
jgi:hypothetical protein